MTIVQILLLVLGAVLFILSFVIPERGSRLSKEDKRLIEKEVRDIVEVEMQEFHARLESITEENVSYAVEKAERSLERLTNEKIMAVSEYSDTVLEEIHKNHEEVVFLYDMLNSKHKDLTSVASEVERTAREAKNVVTASDYVQNVRGDYAGADMAGAVMPIGQGMAGAYPAGALQSHGGAYVPGGYPAQNNGASGGFTPFITRVDMEKEAGSILAVPGGAAGAEMLREVEQQEKAVPKKRGRKPGKSKDKSAAQAEAAAASPDTESYEGKAVREPSFPVVDRPAVSLSFQGDEKENENNNQRILALHKEGKSNVAIARELGLGVGEVKLVIDLFK